MNATESKTMTLGDFLAEYSICRTWYTSVGCPGGCELILNTEGEGEDYCDEQCLLDQAEIADMDLVGTVTQDSDGEYRWGVDSLQNSELKDHAGNTVLNLVVWGETTKPTARDLGWAAGKAGKSASDNPYPISIAGHRMWQKSWELAQRD